VESGDWLEEESFDWSEGEWCDRSQKEGDNCLRKQESKIFDGLVVMHFRKQILEYLLLTVYLLLM